MMDCFILLYSSVICSLFAMPMPSRVSVLLLIIQLATASMLGERENDSFLNRKEPGRIIADRLLRAMI